MTELPQTLTCPVCGETARVVVTATVAEDGAQRIRVERYSCPRHDLVTENAVLAALGLATGTRSTR